jgi:hypothetical protein
MKMNTDFESQFISVNTFRLVCLLPIVAYTYICTFVFDPRVGRYEKSKMFLFLFINIIYGLFNTTEIQNILFKTLSYPIQKIFEFWKRDTWNHSQFLFSNFNKDIINHSNHRIFIFTLLTVCTYNIFCFIYVWLEK